MQAKFVKWHKNDSKSIPNQHNLPNIATKRHYAERYSMYSQKTPARLAGEVANHSRFSPFGSFITPPPPSSVLLLEGHFFKAGGVKLVLIICV